MKIKSLISFLVLIITLVSCEDTVRKNAEAAKKNDLLAQANIAAKEEKIPTLKEVISYDVAFTELNRIVQSSAYAEKFSGKKHYTVLAPLNGAFTKLPKGTVEKLVATENIAELNAIMNCHIIPGLISEKDIIKAIKERNGSVKLKTLGGTRLIATRKGGKIYLIDKNGNAGRLMKTDIEATNGIIHTLETVMLPKR